MADSTVSYKCPNCGTEFEADALDEIFRDKNERAAQWTGDFLALRCRCQRTGKLTFERILADGSKRMDDDYMDSIEPFDFGELVDFSAAYFAGYLADKFDVDAGECKARAVEVVERCDKFIVYERRQNNVLEETSADPNKGDF